VHHEGIVCALGLSITGLSAGGVTFLGPTPYLSEADSPWDTTAPDFHLENFEDGAMNTPGATHNAAAALQRPNPITDSVDGDDGFIDGLGQDGWSLFWSCGTCGITFTFDENELGYLPQRAGVVWTDGWNPIQFEAFDGNGVSLGTVSGSHADASLGGTTGEDRFYGVEYEGGIGSIKVTNGAGIEVDHLQYGLIPETCSGDLDLDGVVGVTDFLQLLAAWGPNPGHPADFDGDDTVGVTDFLFLLSVWGPCP
jgi:hypothetical protein